MLIFELSNFGSHLKVFELNLISGVNDTFMSTANSRAQGSLLFPKYKHFVGLQINF